MHDAGPAQGLRIYRRARADDRCNLAWEVDAPDDTLVLNSLGGGRPCPRHLGERWGTNVGRAWWWWRPFSAQILSTSFSIRLWRSEAVCGVSDYDYMCATCGQGWSSVVGVIDFAYHQWPSQRLVLWWVGRSSPSLPFGRRWKILTLFAIIASIFHPKKKEHFNTPLKDSTLPIYVGCWFLCWRVLMPPIGKLNFHPTKKFIFHSIYYFTMNYLLCILPANF
jgi:hypothetical protein